MTENHIEAMLQQARPADVAIPANREAIRAIVARAADRKIRSRRPAIRPFFAVGVTVGAVLGAVFVLLIKDADARPEPADNLGGVWRTYTDNRSNGAVVWPPSSEDGRNNFVKSAPGFGGSGYAVRFKGTVDGGDDSGFIGVSTFLGPQCSNEACAGVDLRKYRRIRFKMRGSVRGGPLLLIIAGDEAGASHNVDGAQSLSPEFEVDITDLMTDEWRTVTLDLRDDFSRSVTRLGERVTGIESVLSDAHQVKWHVRGGKRAQADVWIDNLEFL